MPDDVRPSLAAAAAASLARPDRASAVAFATDGPSETALRDGLGEWLPGLEIRRGNIHAAIAALRRQTSPRVLIVDVGGEEQPLAALAELSTVVEPDTCVLVTGDVSDLALYREITRGLGAAEYLPKPLTRDLVHRYFGPLAQGEAPSTEHGTGGQLVTVTGVRGGVGASLVAAGLAWHFGVAARRHTVLLDADLHRGTAALLLNVEPGEGLRAALEAPERIDALLAERAARPVADRVHVLSAQEPLTRQVEYAPDAAAQLLGALRRRYNVVLADVPCFADPFCRDLLAAAHHRILVMTPTLPGVRDALRLLALPGGAGTRPLTTLVLNREGMPGGLRRRQVEEALKRKPEVTIPDLPRQVAQAETLGEPASGAFRNGIAAIARQIGTLHPPGAQAAKAARSLPWRLFVRQ